MNLTSGRFELEREDLLRIAMNANFPMICWCLGLAVVVAGAIPALAGVQINEIHYHPVEEAAFLEDGSPVLDLSEDVHEFIEICNSGEVAVDVSGWKLFDAVDFTAHIRFFF